MKKIFAVKIILALLVIQIMGSCEQSFDQPDIKNNPNAVTDVDIATLLAGTELGVSILHEDTDVRIASMWAGELAGLSRAHQGFGQYIVSSQSFSWNVLYPVAS